MKVVLAFTSVLVLLSSFVTAQGSEANSLCSWIGYCVYESPGFRITVVDSETGQPLADVHALVEWSQYGYHGRAGPLMVQDAVSGADGLLVFPAWGPMRGSSAGIVLNQDPVISLFKPGYNALIIHNRPGSDEKARVRGLTQDGQTFKIEPFRGTSVEWVEQLKEAAYPRYYAGQSDAQQRQFASSYLNRWRLVWAELRTIPRTTREMQNFIRDFEDSLKRMEGLRNSE